MKLTLEDSVRRGESLEWSKLVDSLSTEDVTASARQKVYLGRKIPALDDEARALMANRWREVTASVDSRYVRYTAKVLRGGTGRKDGKHFVQFRVEVPPVIEKTLEGESQLLAIISSVNRPEGALREDYESRPSIRAQKAGLDEGDAIRLSQLKVITVLLPVVGSGFVPRPDMRWMQLREPDGNGGAPKIKVEKQYVGTAFLYVGQAVVGDS